jgi:hypothetical protein
VGALFVVLGHPQMDGLAHFGKRAEEISVEHLISEAWSAPRKSWTTNKRRIRPVSLTSEWPNHSGRGQAGDSLPGSGAGSPRLGCSLKGVLL